MTTPTPSPMTQPKLGARPLAALRRRTKVRLGLATLGVCLASALVATPAPAAEPCTNTALREQNNSTELPECRAYEMASSPYKQGYDLVPQTFGDDGIVSYASTGSFAGNGNGSPATPYLGVRTPEGWQTQSLSASESLYYVESTVPPRFSSDMRSSVNTLASRALPADGNGAYVRDFSGTFTRVGTGPVPPSEQGFSTIVQVWGASDDLSHILIGGYTQWSGLEYVGVGEAAVLHNEDVDNSGNTLPGQSSRNAISGDGRVVVFSAGCTGSSTRCVWARIGDTATVAVSGSQCTRGALDPGGACSGLAVADYAGSAADGSRVFFTTSQQLVNGDTDSTPDLYECDIPPGTLAPVGSANRCASLTEVSGAASGANVQSVVSVSEDGSRVYFIAEGAVLAANPGANDEVAAPGNHNLYVWGKDAEHPEGQTTFVGAIDSNGITGAQTTADGRYLVFSTTTALVNSGPGADTDGRSDIYRYDAETQTMQRISTSVTGSGGNNPEFDTLSRASDRGTTPSEMSADGSMVVFATAEALSPQDTDGISDVYLWHNGRVSLISDGGGEVPWIDASGQNIYFVTEQPLTTADRDVNGDIYDARIDGGFDLSKPTPCSGEACQGPSSTPPAPAGAPASATLQGAGNPPQTAPAIPRKAKPLTRQQRLAKVLKQCRKKPKPKRLACERQARKRYAPFNTSARRSHR